MYEKLLQIKRMINNPIEKQITGEEYKWFPGQQIKVQCRAGTGVGQVRCLRDNI